jgi:hypothetical protein
MKVIPLIIGLVSLLALGACASSATKHEGSAAQVLSSGKASVENFRAGSGIGFGEVQRAFRIHGIDGERVARGPAKGVFGLTPGHHVITVWVEFTHVTGMLSTRSIDAAEVEIPVEVVAGRRYTFAGRQFSRESGELWLADVLTGAELGEHKVFPMLTTVQPREVPIIIPIPIH